LKTHQYITKRNKFHTTSHKTPDQNKVPFKVPDTMQKKYLVPFKVPDTMQKKYLDIGKRYKFSKVPTVPLQIK